MNVRLKFLLVMCITLLIVGMGSSVKAESNGDPVLICVKFDPPDRFFNDPSIYDLVFMVERNQASQGKPYLYWGIFSADNVPYGIVCAITGGNAFWGVAKSRISDTYWKDPTVIDLYDMLRLAVATKDKTLAKDVAAQFLDFVYPPLYTATPTATNTLTPTLTPTATNTPTPTFTSTATQIPTNTDVPTTVPTVTATSTVPPLPIEDSPKDSIPQFQPVADATGEGILGALGLAFIVVIIVLMLMVFNSPRATGHK